MEESVELLKNHLLYKAQLDSDDEHGSYSEESGDDDDFFYAELDRICERRHRIAEKCKVLPGSIIASQKGDYEYAEQEYALVPYSRREMVKDHMGMAPLDWSSLLGHHQLTKVLIEEAGADVNHEDHRGFTALQWASRQGHAGVVELIINENPDIDHRNQQGTTSLMFASGMGHLKVVRILLDAGADANETNNDGDTSLLWAAGAGCIDIVKLLIEEHYAYVDHQNKDGLTPLMKASRSGHVDCVEYLLPISDAELKSRTHMRALEYAEEHYTPEHTKCHALLQEAHDVWIAELERERLERAKSAERKSRRKKGRHRKK